MKVFILLCCLVVVSFATPTIFELHSQWNQFKSVHSKNYKNIEEETKRVGIFIENLKEIEEHNKLYEQGLVAYKKGVNQFTDWTQEEFERFLGKSQHPQYESFNTFVQPLNAKVPSAVDWRNKSVVAPIKNQRGCPSWSFSAVAAVESQNAIKTGKLTVLSEQQLIDCLGLGGGCTFTHHIDDAFAYTSQNGLTSAAHYSFTANNNLHCIKRNIIDPVYTKGYARIPSESEADLQSAIANVGPVSVGIDATNWKFYDSGLFTDDCGSDIYDITHYALAVGYGTDEKGHDYWIVKNSFGAGWGENGYIRIPRNQDNRCAIASSAFYPIL